jgi:hypothetical protein
MSGSARPDKKIPKKFRGRIRTGKKFDERMRYYRRRSRRVPHTVLVVAALLCFLLAAFEVPTRVNLVAVGLFCWLLSTVA